MFAALCDWFSTSLARNFVLFSFSFSCSSNLHLRCSLMVQSIYNCASLCCGITSLCVLFTRGTRNLCQWPMFVSLQASAQTIVKCYSCAFYPERHVKQDLCLRKCCRACSILPWLEIICNHYLCLFHSVNLAKSFCRPKIFQVKDIKTLCFCPYCHTAVNKGSH